MKQALVTGGTRGIGAGVVKALVDGGYNVTATGLTTDEVDAFEAVDGVVVSQLDVTSEAQVEKIMASFDRLDALVNCAGVIQRNGLEFDPTGFAETLSVNLTGTLRMCSAARVKMGESGGSMVNIASMLSFFGSAASPGYSASKGGVVQLTKSLAAAWARDKIRVNAVAPGWVVTDLTRPLVNDIDRYQGILGRTPMGRWGTPEEIGAVVRFLLSEDAGFVTGAVVPVDGGYSSV